MKIIYIWFVYCAVMLHASACMCAFVLTSDGCGGGAQDVTCFTGALLQPEGVELQLSSIQQLLGLLV